MAEEVDQTGWTEEQKLLYKHYGRKPGDDPNTLTEKMKADIAEGQRLMRQRFSPTGDDVSAIAKGVAAGAIDLKAFEGRQIGVSFNGIDAKLWEETKIERMRRGIRKSQLLEEALKLWLGKEKKGDSKDEPSRGHAEELAEH